MGVAVSSSCCLCHSFLLRGGLLTLFPCSSMGSLPWETVLHKLLQCESFRQGAVLHKLLQHGSISKGAVLQEQTAPAWVPHGVTSPARKPTPAWSPLCTGPQVLAGACSSMGSPRHHSLLWVRPLCSGMGSFVGRRWISDPPWTSTGCRGTVCLTMVFSTGCRECLLQRLEHCLPCFSPGSWCLLFLSHLTPLSTAFFAAVFHPFSNMLSQRCYHLW